MLYVPFTSFTFKVWGKPVFDKVKRSVMALLWKGEQDGKIQYLHSYYNTPLVGFSSQFQPFQP